MRCDSARTKLNFDAVTIPKSPLLRCSVSAAFGEAIAPSSEPQAHRRDPLFGSNNSEEILKWLTSVLCSSPKDARFYFCRRPRDTLGPRWSSVKRFGWLSLGDGRAYLIPLEATQVGLRALDLYNAQSLKASFAKALFATGLRLGIGRQLVPTVHLITSRKSGQRVRAYTHLLEYLTCVLRREDLSFGISVGTPGPHRKPVLLVLGDDGERLAYVKVGSSQLSNTLVRRETETLQFLARHSWRSFSSPTVLHSGWWNGRYLVVQSAPRREWTATVVARSFRYLDVPKELSTLHTRWMLLGDVGFLEDILLRIRKIPNKDYRDTLEWGVREIDSRLKAERLPFHFSHGDFTPWNTRYEGEKIYVFDWELSRKEGLPAQDVFHFYFQKMRCVMRRDIEKIYNAFLTDRILRSRVEAHLSGLGLTAVPVELLFFLYRLDQLANEAADISFGLPLFREFAAFRNFLNAV